ncbi:hypothetical protein, partial [Acetobacter tropicalis]|uniref:hypothetical protein n=1 Tax=Acetobacter tropicalis TaxID=104102 RepID=UPI0014704C14
HLFRRTQENGIGLHRKHQFQPRNITHGMGKKGSPLPSVLPPVAAPVRDARRCLIAAIRGAGSMLPVAT